MSADSLRAQIDEITIACRTLFDEVESAIESGEKERQLTAGKNVDDLASRYRALCEAQEPADRKKLEMALERRVTDLRRQAANLVQRVGGARATRAYDAGHVPFLEQRSPSSGPAPNAWPTLADRKVSVGSEVESWCGKCKEMRTHGIVAMVADQPKQVICRSCRSTHNHRAEPPARAKSTSAAAAAPADSLAPRERSRREELRRDLQKELNASIEVRPFDPKEEFNRGEIISHPSYGRGKVENVLRGSILVRFLEGLRPLDLG